MIKHAEIDNWNQFPYFGHIEMKTASNLFLEMGNTWVDVVLSVTDGPTGSCVPVELLYKTEF